MARLVMLREHGYGSKDHISKPEPDSRKALCGSQLSLSPTNQPGFFGQGPGATILCARCKAIATKRYDAHFEHGKSGDRFVGGVFAVEVKDA